jgi:2-oxoglutarate ferredoxin oxidoreductase subunit beta
MVKALEHGDKIPIGVIYREEKPTFHEKNDVLRAGGALLDRPTGADVVKSLMAELV